MHKNPQTKKQKIDQNLELISMPDNNDLASPLTALFSYDWFLIEIGRLLMDKNLINILILNKSINKRATIVFRNHFFNFKLQKEVEQLVRERNWDKVQQIFKNHGESLNPNIFLNAKPNEQFPECIHSIIEVDCDRYCDLSLKMELVDVAARLGLSELVHSIVLHKRYEVYSHSESIVLNSTCIANDLESARKLMKKLVYHRNSFEFALKFKNLEFFKLLFEYPTIDEQDSRFFVRLIVEKYPDRKEFLRFCLEYFKETLTDYHLTKLCELDDVEFLVMAVNYVSKQQESHRQHFSVPISDCNKIMSHLLKDTKIDNGKTALRFAFMMGCKNSMKMLFKEREWLEQELLNFLRETRFFISQVFFNSGDFLGCLIMILEKLPKHTILEKEDIGNLLEVYIECNFQKYFTILWLDKRVVKSSELANSLILLATERRCLEVVNDLLKYCDLNAPAQFQIIDNRNVRLELKEISPEFEINNPFESVKINVGLKCWFNVIQSRFVRDFVLLRLEQSFEVKMNQELFDFSIKVAFFNDSDDVLSAFLANKNYVQFWNEKTKSKFGKRTFSESLKLIIEKLKEKKLYLQDIEKVTKLFSN